MCFYIYSPEGEIELEVTETIYFHPRFFTEFGGSDYKGRTTLVIEIFVTVKMGTVDNLRIVYPNVTNYFEDLSKYEDVWNGFKKTWDNDTIEVPYTVKSSFSEDAHGEVLKRIPVEIKTVTFSESLKPGKKVAILLQVGSPNAIDNDVSLDSAHISFNISGPSNVLRSFESGLEGAEKIFHTNMEKSFDSDTRAAYSAALDAVKILNNHVLREIRKNMSYVKSWRFILIFDPRLRNIKIDFDGIEDISKFGSPDDVIWPFDLPLYRKLNPFAKNIPKTRSFVYRSNGKYCENGEVKFEIRGTAHMFKPTQHILTYAALFLAIISILH